MENNFRISIIFKFKKILAILTMSINIQLIIQYDSYSVTTNKYLFKIMHKK